MDIETLSGGYLILGSIVAAFLFILAILWILVPFAVFGTKPLLRTLIAEQRRTYEMLAAVSQQLHNAAAAPPVVIERPAHTTVVETPRRIDPLDPIDPMPPRY